METCPFCSSYKLIGSFAENSAIQLALVCIIFLFGLFLALNPSKAIKLQIAAYKPFNWKLEPISMEKEIKNTRIMGVFVLFAAITAFLSIIVFSR